MAAFATHAFAQVKSLGARVGWNVQRMAGEAFRRLLGFTDTQDSPHAFTDRAGKRVIGFGVFILYGPDAVFVLKNAAVGARSHAAMATRGTAGAGAGVFAGFGGGPGRRIGGARGARPCKTDRDEQNYGAAQCVTLGLRPHSHSISRMASNLVCANVRATSRQKFLYFPLEVKSTKGSCRISFEIILRLCAWKACCQINSTDSESELQEGIQDSQSFDPAIVLEILRQQNAARSQPCRLKNEGVPK